MIFHYKILTGEEHFDGHPTFVSATVINQTPGYNNDQCDQIVQEMYKWCTQQFGEEGDDWVQINPKRFMFTNNDQLMLFKLAWG